MKEQIYAYMHSAERFSQWSTSHVAALMVSLFLILVLPWFAKNKLSERGQHAIGAAIGITITGSLVVWNLLNYLSGEYNIQTDLPLQLCRFFPIWLLFWSWFGEVSGGLSCFISGRLQVCFKPL